MNRFLLIAFFVSCFIPLHAQDDEVIVVPERLIEKPPLIRTRVLSFYPGIWAPGFKLESVTPKKRISFGTHFRGYIFFFNGAKIEPFVRVYFKSNAPQGFFVQAKLSAGIYDANSFLFRGLYCYSSSNGMFLCPGDPGYVKFDMWRYFFGGGVAAGYQFILGKQKRFAFDVFGGLQLIIPTHRIYNDESLALWMMRGFPLETGFRLGWAF
jgi:hypothetical protein